jgi:hypothetical protein
VRAAVEQGVVELVHEGERKGLWKFKTQENRLSTDEVNAVIEQEINAATKDVTQSEGE